MQLERVDSNLDLDPRLQVTLDRLARGAIRPAFSSEALAEIAVLAVVKDESFWTDRTDFRLVANLGKTKNGESIVVTGRVPLRRVPDVHQDDRVVSLKAAQQVGPALRATVPEILADRQSLQAHERQGEGVIVGIVDYGCDFAHSSFRNPDGSSRIEAFWDQSGKLESLTGVDYGRFYSKAEIDAALKSAAPYTALGYDPDPNREGSHGTHVMDIAAGNGARTGAPGVAPKATIIFVHPSVSDIPWVGEEVVTSNFADSVHLLEALEWLFGQAGNRPCVINVSLATNGGPHDGSTPFEQGLDALVSAAPNRAVVIAASNSYEDHIHATGTLVEGGNLDLDWRIPRIWPGPNEMEIWYDGDDEFEVEMLDASGASIGSVPLPGNSRITDDSGNTLIFISQRQNDPLNHDNIIGIFLEGSLSERSWTVRLIAKKIRRSGIFHAWIERNDQAQTSFAGQAVSNDCTLGSLSCGRLSIVVASYDANRAAHPISWFSAAGPTRDGREKPEISAPGQDVLAARSLTGTGVFRDSGTSMAAPAVTGAIAIMLSEALAAGRKMGIDQIRTAVIGSGRHNPPAGSSWDRRYGHGRIDVSAMITDAIA